MNQSYPAPPPELVEQWRTQPEFAELGLTTGVSMTQSRLRDIAAQAARWGADQELEACCEWLDDTDCEDPQEASLRLRWHRRPKPPSLKEQALAALKHAEEGWRPVPTDCDIIRRALEALDD